jgi:hypothetical protein
MTQKHGRTHLYAVCPTGINLTICKGEIAFHAKFKLIWQIMIDYKDVILIPEPTKVANGPPSGLPIFAHLSTKNL